MKRLLISGLLVVVVGSATALGLRARAEAHRLVTNPMATRHLPGQRPIDFGMVYDEVSVTTPDRLKLVGWYIPGTNGALVIAQHGYKADRGEMLNEAAMLRRRGYAVLLTTTRAHDLSDGDVITFGKMERQDLGAWLDFVRSLEEIDDERIGMLGNSLGGTLAIEFAATHDDIKALATHSAFSSLSDTIDTSIRFFTGLPPFPFAPLITFFAERRAGIRAADVDAKKWIAAISPRPVLLLQGGTDVVISTASGQALYDAAREPKELWFEPKVGHAGFDRALPGEYERRVAGFFDRYLLDR